MASSNPAFRELDGTEEGMRVFVQEKIMGAPDLASLCATLALLERYSDYTGLPRDPILGGDILETFRIDEYPLPVYAPLPDGVTLPARMRSPRGIETVAHSLDADQLPEWTEAGWKLLPRASFQFTGEPFYAAPESDQADMEP